VVPSVTLLGSLDETAATMKKRQLTASQNTVLFLTIREHMGIHEKQCLERRFVFVFVVVLFVCVCMCVCMCV